MLRNKADTVTRRHGDTERTSSLLFHRVSASPRHPASAFKADGLASTRNGSLGLRVCLFLFSLLLCPSAQAKTLYVDGATGNDATTWAANGPSNPWRTIGRAAWGSANRAAPNGAEAAQAGDVVSIATGTYASALNTGTGRYDILFNPANNGAAGDPITFRAEGTVAIQAPAWNGPAIGASGRNYIHWTGPFLIDESNILTAPDTGPVVLQDNTGSGIDGATIHGNGAPWADNHVGVRIDACNGCFVRNARIDNFYSLQGATSRNGACIMMYNDDDTLIEHNELFDCPTGIYIKGIGYGGMTQARTIARYNLIHDNVFGGIIVQATSDAEIYQNIIYNANLGIHLSHSTDGYGADLPLNDIIANNVFNSNTGITYSGPSTWTNVRFWNNIWTPASRVHYSDVGAVPGDTSHEHNLYYGFSDFASFGNNIDFDTWKSAYGKDQVSPISLAASDPMFVNPANRDFHLQSGSPARTLGVDILDLDHDGSTTDLIPAGAYVTGDEIIGRGGGGGGPPPPPPPPVPS